VDDGTLVLAVSNERHEKAVIECLEAIRAEIHSLPSRIVWLYVAVMIWLWILAGVIISLVLLK
jgi:hypothetical protein